MTAFSDYLENRLLDITLGLGAAYSLRTETIDMSGNTVYVGLHTTSTNDDNSGTAVSGGSYARTAITFAAPSGGATSNSALVTFPTATASWGTVTHFGIYDAAVAGNLLYWGALTVSKTVDNGDIFTIPASNLTVTLQ